LAIEPTPGPDAQLALREVFPERGGLVEGLVEGVKFRYPLDE
jgi:hypothetical protein